MGDSNLQKYYDDIVGASFLQKGKNANEVVDIITQYEWALNHPRKIGENEITPVPFVYAIELRQKYGATATNLMNNIYAITNTSNNVIDTAIGDGTTATIKSSLSSVYTKVKGTISEALKTVGGEEISNTIGKVVDTISSTTLGSLETTKERLQTSFGVNKSILLSPYSSLYALDQTQKKFCFPLLTEGSAGLSLNNDWSSTGSVGLFSSGISKAIDDLATGLLGFAADVQDITRAFGNKNNGQFVMYNIEKAKAFSFPTTGRTLSVKFPLFNTTKKDAWQDNYKFIILFGLRNMLFRLDNVTYYPPMLYDVSSPGWGRMPFSYVKQFSVKPVGMVRTLSFNPSKLGITNGNTSNTTVNVPEAWIVEIQFMSLIADSANQYLSSIIDLPINARLQ